MDTPIYDMLAMEVLMLGHVFEECEHGLSKSLCDGPMHYPADHHEDEPPF